MPASRAYLGNVGLAGRSLVLSAGVTLLGAVPLEVWRQSIAQDGPPRRPAEALPHGKAKAEIC